MLLRRLLLASSHANFSGSLRVIDEPFSRGRKLPYGAGEPA